MLFCVIHIRIRYANVTSVLPYSICIVFTTYANTVLCKPYKNSIKCHKTSSYTVYVSFSQYVLMLFSIIHARI